MTTFKQHQQRLNQQRLQDIEMRYVKRLSLIAKLAKTQKEYAELQEQVYAQMLKEKSDEKAFYFEISLLGDGNIEYQKRSEGEGS